MGPWWVVVLDYLVNGGEVLGGGKERRRPLGRRLSSYQLFRAALDFFCECLSVCREGGVIWGPVY